MTNHLKDAANFHGSLKSYSLRPFFGKIFEEMFGEI